MVKLTKRAQYNLKKIKVGTRETLFQKHNNIQYFNNMIAKI